MKNKVHYEENLFFLSLQLKLLQEGFRLKLDPDFFLDKILSDIQFLDECLGSLLATLRENHLLIRRAEYLHNLIKVEMVFVDLLDSLTNDQLPFCEYLSNHKDDLRERLVSHKSHIAEVRRLLKELTQKEDEREDVTTVEELNLLTTPHSEEDDFF